MDSGIGPLKLLSSKSLFLNNKNILLIKIYYYTII